MKVQTQLNKSIEDAKRREASKLLHKGRISDYRELTGKKTLKRKGTRTAIDLFCGCGGASLGFINAGYDVIAGVDLAGDALKTYQLNLGNAVKADVRNLPLRMDLDIELLIGCPPCQGFSRMNRSRENDFYRRQRMLLQYFALAVEYLKPKAIMFENIPDAKKSPEFQEMVKFLRFDTAPPYNITYKILDAADYGVPQHRKRLILIGYRNDDYLMVRVLKMFDFV